MKMVSANKFRIIDSYSALYQKIFYRVWEQYVDRKGRTKWFIWGFDAGSCEWSSCTPEEFGSVIEAKQEIANRQKAKGFVSKIVKELTYA